MRVSSYSKTLKCHPNDDKGTGESHTVHDELPTVCMVRSGIMMKHFETLMCSLDGFA